MVQRRKGAMKFALPIIWQEPLTTQAIATSPWWILPNLGLVRMHLPSRISTFRHPSPRCYTDLSFPYPLLRRESSRLQKRAVSQRKTLEFRLQFPSWGEKPILSQPIRPQRLDQRSCYSLGPIRAFDVSAQSVELVGWRRASCRLHNGNKLNLMKQFLTALDKESAAFK